MLARAEPYPLPRAYRYKPMLRVVVLVVANIVFLTSLALAVPVELRGSPASMQRQNRVAVQSELPFARTHEDIERMLDEGDLVRLHGNEDYELRPGMGVNAARPEVRLFVERLAADYHAATGEKLVVTSLVRPVSAQPRNAHALSVHPAGMAIDLRISQQPASRKWIEQHLLEKERAGLLDVTREHSPPHYHIALFAGAYLNHVEELIGPDELEKALYGFDEIDYGVVHEEYIVNLTHAVDTRSDRRSLWGLILRLFNR